MIDQKYTNPPRNMVQEVENVVKAYRTGPIRALAQEPVQNALDAGYSKNMKVRVEYRLLRRRTVDGETCYILTVTDSGTTGLCGRILTREEMNSQGLELEPEEKWAAFEGGGYTKANKDALGSRGQGKAVFLYHSEVPGPTRRMLILYDTLLNCGEYRLGERSATPSDLVRTPPLLSKDARDAIQLDLKLGDVFGGMSVPLDLKPLKQVGTRIIIPFLGVEALDALRNGELERWLQRCWWRAIHADRLEITVMNEEDGWHRTIDVPEWWRSLSLKGTKNSGIHHHRGRTIMIWENEQLQKEGLVVKRLVLLHGEDLEADEIDGNELEYAGIQLLRGQQWIETRGQRELLDSEIPNDVREGFRGFVEFDKVTDEHILRIIERPQHDSFDGRTGGYMRVINKWLKDRVREFSNEMGWVDRQDIEGEQVSQHEKQTMERIANTFLVPAILDTERPDPNRNDPSLDEQPHWICKLLLGYPQPDSLRVDYGDPLRDLTVELYCEPEVSPATSFDLRVTLANEETGDQHEILHKVNELMRPGYKCVLGDWQVVKGRANREKKQLSCPRPKVYILRAEVHSDSVCVAKAQRKLFIAHDPPVQQTKPHLLTISFENLSNPSQRYVNSGDRIRLLFTITNRHVEAFEGMVEARLGDELLADDLAVQLSGTPKGESPSRDVAWNGVWDGELILALDGEAPPTVPNLVRTITLEPGKIPIQADLFDKEKKTSLDSKRKFILFQNDPDNTQSDLPFTLRTTHGGFYPPMWKLDESEASLTLNYPADYPLWFVLKNAALAKRGAFTEEIIFQGLLEWALRPIQENGDVPDVTNVDSLLEASLDDVDEKLRRRYLDMLEALRDFDPESGAIFEFNLKWREAVALMLAIFRRGNA